jgi:hypothetical protein
MLKVTPVSFGQRRDQARQVVAGREAVADEQHAQ